MALRARPAAYFERLAQLSEGTPLQIVGERDGWFEVRLPVKVLGWVSGKALDASNTVVADSCPMRTGAGESFTAFYQVPKGTRLVPDGRKDGEWIRVAAPPEATGWISMDYAARGDSPAAPPVSEVVSGAEANLAAQRQALKDQHAREAQQLAAEQERLKQLQQQATNLRAQTDTNNAEVQRLQTEALAHDIAPAPVPVEHDPADLALPEPVRKGA